ncbi:flagellar biosynthetic protein FliQ [Limnohabitans sp. Rim11]|jgi:flagellar biosynthetic protein FliQ|uniref:flagellar biosynthetic protein FliQ n=1 Tax=Limnohabitans sp. Rim11 TaxID=1100719 RepID=UPI000AA8AA0B|nr:flagellar biosynthetic protein FliQ [Limnohabitans sp. Rim11]
MDSGLVIEVTFKALWMAFVLSGPVLIALLVVGLIIGILQAATSVNESSVAFIPKLLVIAVVLLVAGPVSLALFVDYLREVIMELPDILR